MLNGITLGIIITLILLFLCIILSILINTLLSPLSKTPNDVLDEILDIVNLNSKDTFVDLGSGDGRMVIRAHEQAGCVCTGYDISPVLIMTSRMRKNIKFPTNKNINFEPENIFKVDFSKATKVYCFLDETSLKILRPRLEAFVKDGGEVYSYKYDIKRMKNEKKVALKNKENLYIYKK